MALDVYSERLPSAALRGLVACVWTRLSIPGGEGAVDADVVPDACMDILWRAGHGLAVAGPDTTPYRIRHTEPTRFVGVRFRPGVAPALLGVAASELRDQRVDLADVWGKSATEQVANALEAASSENVQTVLERTIAERMVDAPPPDPLVQALVHELRRTPAGVSVIASDLGISERHLRRRCEVAVGYGPKTLERVLRFQHFRRLVHRSNASLAQLAVESGYADQAHLNREYLRLAGTTPGRARLLAA
jgi:AraC-like DNA-binding protein